MKRIVAIVALLMFKPRYNLCFGLCIIFNFEVYKHCQRHNGPMKGFLNWCRYWQLELGEKSQRWLSEPPIRHLHLYYAAAYRINWHLKKGHSVRVCSIFSTRNRMGAVLLVKNSLNEIYFITKLISGEHNVWGIFFQMSIIFPGK